MSGFSFAVILPAGQPGRRRLWFVLPAALFFTILLVFLNVGRWLVVEDPLQHSDAIAVLSGRMPGRALEAARIYKQGYAPRVWLTYSVEPAATMKKLSVPYAGEEMYDRAILLREGVPEIAIQLLEPPIENTADEMSTIGGHLREVKLNRVILVTSKVHTRRTKTLWKRVASQNGAAIVRGVSDDTFDPAHWWRSTSDALEVVREVLGLVNAWSGLPLRPSR